MKTTNFTSFLRHSFSGTMISRLSGFGREVIMAFLFGTTSVVANFWMAFRFAHLLRRFFSEGAMHVSFLPHFTELKEKNPQEAAYFFYELTLWVSGLLLGIVLIVAALLGSFLYFGNCSETTEQVMKFTLILSPSLIFICLYGLNSSFLHTENRFFVSSVAPTLVNGVWILGALLFMKYAPWAALQKLSMVIVFGFALQYVVTLPSVFAFMAQYKIAHQKELSIHVRGQMKAMLKPFFYAMVGVTATQLNSALDMLFAKAASAEGPAYLWYALRLQQLPLALFGVGIATVLLPALSKNMDQSAKEGIMQFALKKAVVLMVPITLAFFVMAPSMVQVVFGYGKFSQNAALETSRALIMYAGALLPMTLVFILASWFYAKKETRLPALCALGSVVVNIILNSLFVYLFGWGAESIALATTISSIANVAFLLHFIVLGGVKLFTNLFLVTLKTTTASFISASAALQCKALLSSSSAFTLLIVQGTTFATLFLACSYLFKLKEFTEFLVKKSS